MSGLGSQESGLLRLQVRVFEDLDRKTTLSDRCPSIWSRSAALRPPSTMTRRQIRSGIGLCFKKPGGMQGNPRGVGRSLDCHEQIGQSAITKTTHNGQMAFSKRWIWVQIFKYPVLSVPMANHSPKLTGNPMVVAQAVAHEDRQSDLPTG